MFFLLLSFLRSKKDKNQPRRKHIGFAKCGNFRR